jgi:hypothetical protein
MMLFRRLLPIALSMTALAVAEVAAASTSTYRSGPLTATFTAGTHHPNCKQLWPVTVTAYYHGRPAHAVAQYQFLYQGQVVSTVNPFSGTRKNRANRPYSFYKSFYDNGFGPFGANAVGQPITVRAVVKVGRYTAYPSYWVVVVKTSGCKAIRRGP